MLPGSTKPRSPAKLQGDSSYTKRAEAISPSGVNWKTSSARSGRIRLFIQASTASLALPGLTASLARAALHANTACPGANNFVAAADRANYAHEHVAQGYFDPISVGVAFAQHLRISLVRRMARNHID